MVTRLATVALLATLLQEQAPQLLGAHQRGQAKRMLANIQAAIKEAYYDPSFRGIDLDAHFNAAAAKLDQARSLAHAYGIIAQTLIAFEDSHTYFIPPENTTTVEYGWQMRMFGDACLVTAVRPGSDAAAQGLAPGDRVLQVDQFPVTRKELWKLRYLLNRLSPRAGLKVLVQGPSDAAPRTLEIAAKVTTRPKVKTVNLEHIPDLINEDAREARQARNRFARIGDVAIWKLSGFDFRSADVDKTMDEGLKDATSLVLDMRGNGGGLVTTLELVAGRLFDRDVRLGDLKTRKSSTSIVVKKRRKPFMGKIVALIDADSGSASEILARLLQLEERGIVIGDRSAGAVMQSRIMGGRLPVGDGTMFYSASITTADLIMTDGASLEKVGVTPDELLLPSAADLAGGKDPVLARAVGLLGGSIDPVAAGALFPMEWK